MGRPIASKYFGNRNTDGVGGEGVASIALGGTNNSSGYTTGDALTFTAPQITGGTTAAGTVTANGGGYITAATITNAGTGYTSAPTVTAATGTQGTLTLTATLILTIGKIETKQGNCVIKVYKWPLLEILVELEIF